MFSKSKDNHAAKPNMAGGLSIIAAGVTITGNLEATGEIQLDGAVVGDIKCTALSMGESGKLEGNLTADTAVIRGAISGSLQARTVMLERSARVQGDIRHESISIEAGAWIEGRFVHLNAASEVGAPAVSDSAAPALKAVAG
jgi:cytoskeletal protein CcmA (bactofilin family)